MIRILASLFFITSLVACGGGGSGGSSDAQIGTFPDEAKWSFDSLNGSTAPNSFSAELSASLNSVNVVPGVIGTAIRLDPTLSQSLAIVSLHQLQLSFPNGHLSIAMWINPSTLDDGATYHLFGTNFSFNLRLIDGRVTFLLRPSSGSSNNQDQIVQSSRKVSRGVWQHLALTYDGITAKVYINGALDASASLVHPVMTLANTSIMIGGLSPDTGFKFTFPGAIDEVYFAGRTISASDVAILAKKPS